MITFGLPTPVKQTHVHGLFVSAINLNRDTDLFEVGVFTDDTDFSELHMIRFETSFEAIEEHDRCVELIRSAFERGELAFEPRRVIEA